MFSSCLKGCKKKKKLHPMHSLCFPWHKSCLKLRLCAILSLKGNNRVPAAPDKYNCQFLLLFHLLLSECYQQDLCLCRMWGCVNLEILLNLTQHSDMLCFFKDSQSKASRFGKGRTDKIFSEKHERVITHPRRLQFCFCPFLNTSQQQQMLM